MRETEREREREREGVRDTLTELSLDRTVHGAESAFKTHLFELLGGLPLFSFGFRDQGLGLGFRA